MGQISCLGVPSYWAFARPQKPCQTKAFLKKQSLPALTIPPLITPPICPSIHPPVHPADAYIAPKALPKFGRRRCSPLGAFNPPPTEGVRSVLDHNKIGFRYSLEPITDRESERPSSLCRPRLLVPSLFLSPVGPGPPESRGKKAQLPSCWASWVDFWPFPSVLRK